MVSALKKRKAGDDLYKALAAQKCIAEVMVPGKWGKTVGYRFMDYRGRQAGRFCKMDPAFKNLDPHMRQCDL
jgi:hypothetical protein